MAFKESGANILITAASGLKYESFNLKKCLPFLKIKKYVIAIYVSIIKPVIAAPLIPSLNTPIKSAFKTTHKTDMLPTTLSGVIESPAPRRVPRSTEKTAKGRKLKSIIIIYCFAIT